MPVADDEYGSRTRFWTTLADIHHPVFPIEIFRPRSTLPGSIGRPTVAWWSTGPNRSVGWRRPRSKPCRGSEPPHRDGCPEGADCDERPAVVGIVHAETSTGVWQPVEEIARIAGDSEPGMYEAESA